MSFQTIPVFPNVRLLVPIQLLGAVPAHVAATPIDDGKHRRWRLPKEAWQPLISGWNVERPDDTKRDKKGEMKELT